MVLAGVSAARIAGSRRSRRAGRAVAPGYQMCGAKQSPGTRSPAREGSKRRRRTRQAWSAGLESLPHDSRGSPRFPHDRKSCASHQGESNRTSKSRTTSARQIEIQQIEEDPLSFLSSEDHLFIHQLAASGCACDVCGDPDHFLRECPHSKKLRENPEGCQRILAGVRDLTHQSSTSGSRGGSNGNRRPSTTHSTRALVTSNRSQDRPVRELETAHDTDVDDNQDTRRRFTR